MRYLSLHRRACTLELLNCDVCLSMGLIDGFQSLNYKVKLIMLLAVRLQMLNHVVVVNNDLSSCYMLDSLVRSYRFPEDVADL